MYGRKVKLRFFFILLILLTLILSVFLILKSLEENVVYFQSPTEIKTFSEIDKKKIRIGGMVKVGSISMEVKEIKFRPGTDTHDYEVKMRSVTKFLEKGDKVKITLRFRGREMAHQELGRELLERVAADIEGFGKIENIPKMEGRQMTMMIGPTSSK